MANLRPACSAGFRSFPPSQSPMRAIVRQVNCKVIQHPRSPFISNACLHSQFARSAKNFHFTHDQYPPPPREPPGSSHASLIVGSVIAGCSGLYAYKTLQEVEFKNGSKKAYVVLQYIRKNFVLSLDNIREGRYLVVLTSSFAHANLTHLTFNMLALWGFGRTIILWFGLPHFAVIWAGSALAGSILQLGYWEKLEDPGRIHQAVGASGALFGLMSALAVVAPKMPMLLFFVPMTMRTAMIVSAALSLGAINQGWLPWLGHVDHLGGMAFGFVYGLVALRRGRISRISKYASRR